MRAGVICTAVLVPLALCRIAAAFPDGPPWGSANPAAEENCANCHFGDDPVENSETLTVTGLPADLANSGRYELWIRLAEPDAAVAGFQLFAATSAGDAGLMTADGDHVEAVGAAVRSIQPITVDNVAAWSLTWQLPARVTLPVVLYVAASAANDDGSPLGDTIHYRQYTWADKQSGNEAAAPVNKTTRKSN